MRSPMFQQRKAMGMNIAGGVLCTEVMFAVKTGKIIVMAKHMKTAVARKGIRRKSVVSGMEARVVAEERRRGSELVSLVRAPPSEVPFVVGLEAEERVEVSWAMEAWRRRRQKNASSAIAETTVAVRK